MEEDGTTGRLGLGKRVVRGGVLIMMDGTSVWAWSFAVTPEFGRGLASTAPAFIEEA